MTAPEKLTLDSYRQFAEAFEREAQDTLRYLYFARLAEIEGQPQLVELFTEFAQSSRCCAHGHLDVLRNIGDPRSQLPIGASRRNVASAAATERRGELDEYPRLANQARADGLDDYASWAETLVGLKRAHRQRCEQALDLAAGAATNTSPASDEPQR